ncbi:MAG: asparagine synthetase B family protein [Pseudomonadota bacterium]
MIGEYLVSAINNKEETLYQGIFRLPPAHFLIVEPGRIRKRAYWELTPEKKIRYRSDEEYTDHFLEIFTEAVQCRMRTAGRVGAQLSGGLDSSAVACVSQSLIRNGAVSGNGFETFSVVFPGWLCDESEYIEAVNRKWCIHENALPPKIRKRSGYEAQVEQYLDIPDYPNGSMSDSIENLAKKKGFTVLLTGLGGDEWFTGSQYHYCDLLRKFRIQSFFRHVRQEFGLYSVIPLPSKPLLNYSLRPLIPEKFLRGLRGLANRSNKAPAWIEPAFSRSIGLPERMARKVDWRRFSSCAQAAQYTASTSGFQTHAIEMEERSASYFGIELRHPFHDRRILEFGMAIPEDQRCRGDRDKFIVHRAMRDYFPETVLQRHTKAEFSQVFKKALQVQGGERIFDSLSIADMGWVKATEIQRMYKEFKQMSIRKDEEIKIELWPFWHIFGIELWFNCVYPNTG